ncbi:MAG: hypothetical protein K2W78_08275 [Xanthobacteraceae bacterium]|nr:hypothetical protein [Xanthobacteraceae bacterium]
MRRIQLLLSCLVLAVSGTVPAMAIELTPPQADLYMSVSINPPSATEMTICYGFVCRRRAILEFSSADHAALTQILASGKANAASERAALQRAVMWWDRRVGPMIGTNIRVAKADIRAGSDATNFDCFDTTRDTTSLLLVLQEWGLLKHHTVGNPRYRGNPFALQTPHNTAVVIDSTTHVEWVVDLWPKKYAEAPDVMPVEKWLTED